MSSLTMIPLSAMFVTRVEPYKDGGIILVLFEDSISENYEAFDRDWYLTLDRDWYLTLAGLCWMIFMCWNVYARGPKVRVAWVTFTRCSWTVVTIRYGLCVYGPFVPSVRLASEIRRFPAIISATLVFFLWNFYYFRRSC